MQRLAPKLHFQFYKLKIEGQDIVILEIPSASKHPTSFQNEEWVRVGSYRKKIKDYPEKARELWRNLDKTPFESLIVLEKVDDARVLELLDYTGYFELLEIPVPDGNKAILEALVTDDVLTVCEAGGYNITNLGAILFAKDLNSFGNVKRKAIRVIQYKGENKLHTIREQVGGKGYASGFEGLIEYIMALLPTNEVIESGLRKEVPMYPELAVRELIANALIHQDFYVAGTGPTVEIYDRRIEITNPGEPLVETNRFLNSPPKSRNEKLASLMRRLGICEERGSGIDKVVYETELNQLPAPLFEVLDGFTQTVLFAHRDLKNIDKTSRQRACYFHACLKYEERDYMSNSSLRERFGIDAKNSAMVSRIIKDSLEAGLICLFDESVGAKAKRYIPAWARS
ncbi:hypothetical protein SMSP2_02098 [Limihaloglobus sulfuriphilus]|uniref:Uncharacterized protein n=1 Tax=Limihaloglobus sulfuriphilus TaxID=1851148 RepID=A0A1Q2MGB5_9BACT|nr:ATP-binding protein [Limihaloglobus sulfuriphilus]AQQ71720.1 hypothetical protein SMSP2_02098 [Limihaloglobus sulfuriphilus]